jgi:uncharacterized Zn finger protein
MTAPATSRERRALRIVAEGRVRPIRDAFVSHHRVLGDAGKVYNVLYSTWPDHGWVAMCDCEDQDRSCKHVLAVATFVNAPMEIRDEVERIGHEDGWR